MGVPRLRDKPRALNSKPISTAQTLSPKPYTLSFNPHAPLIVLFARPKLPEVTAPQNTDPPTQIAGRGFRV